MGCYSTGCARFWAVAAIIVSLLVSCGSVQADVYQWLASPTYGVGTDHAGWYLPSATLCAGGSGVNAVPGANLNGKNLTQAYLVGADLSNVSFYTNGGSGANLTNATLVNANLSNAIFYDATLTGVDFTGATIAGASLNWATSKGFTKEQLYSTASYVSGDLSRIILGGNDLSGWSFAGKNLANATFWYATLTGTDFTGATIKGAKLSSETSKGFTKEQLYSTASYVGGDLTRIDLMNNDHSGWSFAGKNLSNANLGAATLTNADFANANLTNANFYNAKLTGADLRGAQGAANFNGTTVNVILPDGKMNGLSLSSIGTLIIRNHDSIPVSFQGSAAMAAGTTMQFVFDGSAWHAPTAFGPGVAPAFADGTLEIVWSAEAGFQLDEPIDLALFQWGDVPAAARQFDDVRLIGAPAGVYLDASRLYSDGTVSLIPEPATLSLLALGGLMLARRRR